MLIQRICSSSIFRDQGSNEVDISEGCCEVQVGGPAAAGLAGSETCRVGGVSTRGSEGCTRGGRRVRRGYRLWETHACVASNSHTSENTTTATALHNKPAKDR